MNRSIVRNTLKSSRCPPLEVVRHFHVANTVEALVIKALGAFTNAPLASGRFSVQQGLRLPQRLDKLIVAFGHTDVWNGLGVVADLLRVEHNQRAQRIKLLLCKLIAHSSTFLMFPQGTIILRPSTPTW